MKSVTVLYNSARSGFPLNADTGETVYAELAEGLVLRKSTDCLSWEDVAYQGPFQHSGQSCTYQIDCVEYTAPVSAQLSISP